MKKVLLTVLTAASVLAGCTTDTGVAYTARSLNIAGQGNAYRLNCTSIFSTEKSCMSKAQQICKDQQVVLVQALDDPKSRPGGSSAHEINFVCAGATQKPAT